jgi:stalled ribosome rescue protein Dom34
VSAKRKRAPDVENRAEIVKKIRKAGKTRRKTLHRDMPKVGVKVEKKAFDDVLGRLIQSGPQPEKRLK